MPYVPCVSAWSTWPRVHVPTCQKCTNFSFLRANVPMNVPTCQRCPNYSTWRANVPWCRNRASYSTWLPNVPQGVPIFQLRLPKGVTVFQLFFKRIFQFLNFSIMLNICKFREYLDNSRKLISRNKKFKF